MCGDHCVLAVLEPFQPIEDAYPNERGPQRAFDECEAVPDRRREAGLCCEDECADLRDGEQPQISESAKRLTNTGGSTRATRSWPIALARATFLTRSDWFEEDCQ